MSLIVSAKGAGKDFAIHPAMVTAARCTRIIDLGTVDGEYKGKAKKIHKIMFAFESAELMPDTEGEYAGKPFLVIQRYTASLSEKGLLRPALESWRGRKFTPAELDAFDLKNVLGKACMLNVVHTDPDDKGKVYANLSAIMPLPKGMTAPEAVGDLVFFSCSDFDQAAFDKLSDGLKEQIKKSDEYKALFPNGAPPAPAQKQPAAPVQKSQPADEIQDDDIPF
jgi:hypothetical protein